MAVKGLTPGYLRRGTDGDLGHKEGRREVEKGVGGGMKTIKKGSDESHIKLNVFVIFFSFFNGAMSQYSVHKPQFVTGNVTGRRGRSGRVWGGGEEEGVGGGGRIKPTPRPVTNLTNALIPLGQSDSLNPPTPPPPTPNPPPPPPHTHTHNHTLPDPMIII